MHGFRKGDIISVQALVASVSGDTVTLVPEGTEIEVETNAEHLTMVKKSIHVDDLVRTEARRNLRVKNFLSPAVVLVQAIDGDPDDPTSFEVVPLEGLRHDGGFGGGGNGGSRAPRPSPAPSPAPARVERSDAGGGQAGAERSQQDGTGTTASRTEAPIASAPAPAQATAPEAPVAEAPGEGDEGGGKTAGPDAAPDKVVQLHVPAPPQANETEVRARGERMAEALTGAQQAAPGPRRPVASLVSVVDASRKRGQGEEAEAAPPAAAEEPPAPAQSEPSAETQPAGGLDELEAAGETEVRANPVGGDELVLDERFQIGGQG